jgi:putative transposase
LLDFISAILLVISGNSAFSEYRKMGYNSSYARDQSGGCMSRFRVSELDPRLVNLEAWPSVAEDAIKDPRLLEQYQMRRNAMKLLILGASRREITEVTGIDRLSIIRLFKRCLLIHPDGRIYGFRAPLSRTRIMPHRRPAPVAVTTATSNSGASGAFGNLLSRFPDIERELQDYVLKRARRKAWQSFGKPVRS